MTDQSDRTPHDNISSTEPIEPIVADPDPAVESAPPVTGSTPSRWERMRPRGRLGQVALVLVSIAAAIFIVGSIFVAGFLAGSESGHERHHGDGGYGHSRSHNEGEQRRGGEESGGPGRDGNDRNGSRPGDSGQRHSDDGDGPGHG